MFSCKNISFFLTKPMFLIYISQVNSIAWANNMVEAMMSDSDDDEKNENDYEVKEGESEDDSGNQVAASPSKKV